MRLTLILLTIFLLGGCQSTFFAAVNARQPSKGVVAHRDNVYDATHGLALDVYAPAQANHAPVVVFFYGGSWKNGKRQWYRWVGQALASQGIVAVIADYRLWPAVRMDGFLHDGAEAVRWARDHAAHFGGDPAHLFVMGHSAGGHIAAMLATDKQWLAGVGMKPGDLSGWIGVAGAYDFLPLDDPDFIDMFGKTPEQQARSQPINFVDGDEPPALLLQGEADSIVFPSEAISMEGRYRQQGESVELKLYPKLGHEGLLFALGPLHGRAPALDDVVSFVREKSTPAQ
ncbi:Acetyl esterase/lipase [Luteibacter sp. UNCMF331Sha3.1]|uniref:alpha/beta hydrolase n=1 Tax=Luteibacter sp. UNCMF331Sha3.1 TaxID=1502760 RepID=UPI0008BB8240|nr:alpha/beta hydrolase [Luteibacter sp. UNCMF331Sha3.1]SEM84499.1 Acetyl esterase/lipase [Luteibacter sp. UNCMF331Sha3.1]